MFLSSCLNDANTLENIDESNSNSANSKRIIPDYVRIVDDESEYIPLFGHKYYVVGEITDYYCNLHDGPNYIGVKDSYITVKCNEDLLTVIGYSVAEGDTASSAWIESSQYLKLDDSIKGRTAVVFFSDTDTFPTIQRDDVLIADEMRTIYRTPEECLERMIDNITRYKNAYHSIPEKMINSAEEALVYTANKMGYTDCKSIDLKSDKPRLYLNENDYLEIKAIKRSTGYENYSSNAPDSNEYVIGKYPIVWFDIVFVSKDYKYTAYSLNINGKYFESYINENGENMIRVYDSPMNPVKK